MSGPLAFELNLNHTAQAENRRFKANKQNAQLPYLILALCYSFTPQASHPLLRELYYEILQTH